MSHIFWAIEYIATCIEFYLGTIFFGTLIGNDDLKADRPKRLLVTVGASLSMILINQIDLYSLLTAVSGLLLMFLTAWLLHLKHPFKALVLSILYILLITGIDNVIGNSISLTLAIPISEIYKELSLYRVLAMIGSKTMLAFLVVFTNKLFSKKHAIRRRYLIVLFAVSAVMLLVTVLAVFTGMEMQTVPSLISVLFFVIMLAFVIVFFFGTFQLTDHYEKQKLLELTELKNAMLEQSVAETEKSFLLWKTSMHDYKHNILSLKTLVEQGDMDAVEAFLAQETVLINGRLFCYQTGNSTVDTILNIKQKLAEDKGITFIIHAHVPETCRISDLHFASLLGNLIDNATEAAAQEQDPVIEVNMQAHKQVFVIAVSNTCTKEQVSLETTKPEKAFHGIGLQSVRQIVEAYEGELETALQDGMFVVRVVIPG